jgi:hypothetical protein
MTDGENGVPGGIKPTDETEVPGKTPFQWQVINLTPWTESASELDRQSDQREVVSTFSDRECHVVSVTDPYGRILGYLDRTSAKS